MTTLDVTDYGAVGDGTADDTAAIQAAIDDAAAGDTVYLPQPSSYYKIQHTDPANDNGEILRIDGDSHPNDLTVKGDGEATTVRLGSGHEDNLQMLRIHINSGITGLEIRDMVLDGDKANQPQSPGVGACILARYADSGTDSSDVDILIENVLAKRAVGSGISMHTGGGVVRNCTVDDSAWHGFNTAVKDGAPSTPKTEFRNCLAKNCTNSGYYGIDVSSEANAIVTDTVLKDNRQGTKTVDDTQDAVYRRVRINGTDAAGVQRPNPGSDSTSHPITLGDMVIENTTNFSIRAVASDDVSIEDNAEVVITGCASDKKVDAWFAENTSLSAPNATVYINNSDASYTYFNWDSSGSGTIGALETANNAGTMKNNGNLTIEARGSTEKTDLASVPTESDVGAWSGDSTSDDDSASDDDSTDSGFDSWTPRWAATTDDWSVVERTAFEGGHALEFDHTGTERTPYALSWDEAGTPADVEVLDRFRVPDFADDSIEGYHARLHLRSSTVDGVKKGYWLEAETPADGFRLAKYTTGSLTTLARFGSPVENTFYYRRFRAQGDTLQAKVWPAGESEPDAWDVEVTDTDLDSGWVGTGSYDPQPTETDVFSVGTGGESAPLSPGDDAPTVGWVDPNDGATVTGDVAVRLDATDPEDANDSLTVEYRVGDGAWTTASYDSSAGSYVATWDSSSVPDGGYTLSARATDSVGNTGSAAVDVTVANDLAVETVDAGSATETAATLVGSLSSLGDSASATGAFEYRERGADTWTVAGEQTLEMTGQFDAGVTGLSAGTGYEFRAVATADDSDAGATLAFDTATADGTTSLSIDRFDAADDSNPAWSRFDVDWAVSDADGELNTVITELRYGGVTVAAESTNVTGSRAAHSHELRVKGPVDEVWLGVNDTANEIVSESKNV